MLSYATIANNSRAVAMGDGTLLPITWLRATGARGGAEMADHDGMDFFRARSDGYLLWEDGVIWI